MRFVPDVVGFKVYPFLNFLCNCAFWISQVRLMGRSLEFQLLLWLTYQPFRFLRTRVDTYAPEIRVDTYAIMILFVVLNLFSRIDALQNGCEMLMWRRLFRDISLKHVHASWTVEASQILSCEASTVSRGAYINLKIRRKMANETFVT